MKARSRKRAGLLVVDQAMVDDAAYGLMLWDGESKGTLNSVINMVRQDKPVVVYLAPQKDVPELRSASDVMDLLSNCDRASVQRFERELGIEHVQRRAPLSHVVHTTRDLLRQVAVHDIGIALRCNQRLGRFGFAARVDRRTRPADGLRFENGVIDVVEMPAE